MHLGLHALGVGPGARREVIDAVSIAAEAHEIRTLWVGEHVVMVDRSGSRYPYAPDGKIAVPPDADWLDPLIALSFAAAVTHSVRLATGVLLVPEHNPVMLAKRAASLDTLSGGRLALGIGVGWSQEEFAALGIPFERRGDRADEYLEAMRALWRDDPASFAGEFISFADIRVNPKPARAGGVPIIVGGNSDRALRRAARLADGWYGFNLDGPDHVHERITRLRDLCRSTGRDPSDVEVAVALAAPEAGDRARLDRLGVDEFVIVGSPPAEPDEAERWLIDLKRHL